MKIFRRIASRYNKRWHITLNLEAAELHAALRHQEPTLSAQVGIDRGLKTFAVVAAESGTELARIVSPRPLRRDLTKLRRKSKALSRKTLDSRRRHRARARVAKAHARISYVRRDFVHRESSRLDRFFPSTRKCSACGVVGEKLALSERIFHCSRCGHEADSR